LTWQQNKTSLLFYGDDMEDDEYVDVLDEINTTMQRKDIAEDIKTLLSNSKQEIEYLRGALTMFSEEFEKIRQQDEQMMRGFVEGPVQ